MFDSLIKWLNANPGLAALFLPFVFGIIGHALAGTPLGRLLAVVGIDFVRLATLVTPTKPGDGTAQPNPSGQAPAAPKLPPGVTGLLLAGALVIGFAGACVTGCAHPLDTAITSVNTAREAGMVAHDVIEATCVPAYKAAATPAALAAVDAKCVPAEKAYQVFSGAHAVAVVAVQRAQLGVATEADAIAAAVALGKASAGLVSALQAVTQ